MASYLYIDGNGDYVQTTHHPTREEKQLVLNGEYACIRLRDGMFEEMIVFEGSLDIDWQKVMVSE